MVAWCLRRNFPSSTAADKPGRRHPSSVPYAVKHTAPDAKLEVAFRVRACNGHGAVWMVIILIRASLPGLRHPGILVSHARKGEVCAQPASIGRGPLYSISVERGVAVPVMVSSSADFRNRYSSSRPRGPIQRRISIVGGQRVDVVKLECYPQHIILGLVFLLHACTTPEVPSSFFPPLVSPHPSAPDRRELLSLASKHCQIFLHTPDAPSSI